MHKVITFGIPSYNAAKDMDHCITSILEGSNYATDIEIIIVDDGSKDETAAKADEWEARYPGIIRAVHQENGGHGIAVLSGLREAQAPTTRLSTRTTGLTALPFRPCCRFCVALRSATSALTCLSRTTCMRRFTRARIPLSVTNLPCRAKRSFPGIRSVISAWTRTYSCTACAIARMCCASPTFPCRRTRSM